MDIFELIAEQKIQKAMKQGEFDHLPGSSQPLHLEDLSHIPDELRVGYLMMKRANMLPQRQQLNKEIKSLQDLLEHCKDNEEKRSELEKMLAVRKKLKGEKSE